MRLSRSAILVFVLAVTGFGQTGPRKLSRSEAMSSVATKVSPEYPAIARQLKLEGVVELEVTLAESGGVESVTIVSGNPVLTKPASEAVKKWKFTPQNEGGKPVKAVAPVSITFKL